MLTAERPVERGPVEPVFRTASPADAGELARLLTELAHPTTPVAIHARWPSFTAEGNSTLVAAADDRLLGLLTLHVMHVLHRPAPVGRITALVVDPDARRRGIGRRLVAEAEHTLSVRGCGLIEVTSNERLVEAHDFYMQLGYRRTSLRFAKSL